MCNDTMVLSQALISNATGSVMCYAGSCGSFPHSSISADIPCTDFSTVFDFSSGERYDVETLTIGQWYTFGLYSNAWMPLAIGGSGDLKVMTMAHLAVRPDGKINSSPVTAFLPIVSVGINIQQVLKIPMFDLDSTDTLKCRWSTNTTTITGFDECGSTCAPSLPTGHTLFSDNCTLVFTLNATNYFAVALQIEDFYTPASTSPMSSIPVQFVLLGRLNPSGCATAPMIVGTRPNSGIEQFFS